MTARMLEVFQKLTKVQQETLTYARDQGICQFIEYEPGKYLGIDASYNPKLKPEEEDGYWSLGSIQQPDRASIPNQRNHESDA